MQTSISIVDDRRRRAPQTERQPGPRSNQLNDSQRSADTVTLLLRGVRVNAARRVAPVLLNQAAAGSVVEVVGSVVEVVALAAVVVAVVDAAVVVAAAGTNERSSKLTKNDALIRKGRKS